MRYYSLLVSLCLLVLMDQECSDHESNDANSRDRVSTLTHVISFHSWWLEWKICVVQNEFTNIKASLPFQSKQALPVTPPYMAVISPRKSRLSHFIWHQNMRYFTISHILKEDPRIIARIGHSVRPPTTLDDRARSPRPVCSKIHHAENSAWWRPSRREFATLSPSRTYGGMC